jgi:glycosyltransferase involved in cell wall biosynthesis
MIPRIVFDCERMKHTSTGLYHYCLHLGRYLQKNLDEFPADLTFYSPLSAVHKFHRDTMFMLQHSLQKFYMPSVKRFDIWHSTYQLSRYIPQRNRKIKVVLTIHDLNFIHEKMPEARKIKLLRRLQRNIDRSDALVCISEFSKKDLLEHCHTGNKTVHLIYNGTNTLKSPGLYDHSYRPERPFLFSLGVMCRKKNFHVLLPLLQQNHGMELLIAGRLEEPDYLQFIHQSARKMRVEGNVRVLGDISEPEKSWYYQNCYAFALPSIAEGFGLPVTEAMSAGKPVFLSNRTALPEIGSTAAFYFRDFNASHMQQVFADGMEQYETQNMQQLIRERSASFCWDKAAKEYIDVYRSLY